MDGYKVKRSRSLDFRQVATTCAERVIFRKVLLYMVLRTPESAAAADLSKDFLRFRKSRQQFAAPNRIVRRAVRQ